MLPGRTGRAVKRVVSTLIPLLVMIVAGSAPGHSASDVAGDVKRTRFVIGLDRNVQFQVSALNNPNRVVVELPEVGMQLPTLPDGKVVGLVKGVRGGLSAPGRSRVVIDVSASVVVESSQIERDKDGRNHRLVLEIVPAASADKSGPRKPIKPAAFGLGAAGIAPAAAPGSAGLPASVQPPLPRKAEAPKAKAARTYKPIVVIDPGHGGQDSGAQKFGTMEKDVVLTFGRLLRDKLVATGRYQVLMTRDTDVFVELDDRLEFAEKNKAALFISVHADYANSSARGATIYSLREGVAEDLKRSAKASVSEKALVGKDLAAVRQEAGADTDLVKNILADLAQREVDVTRERTNVFTRSVIEFMGQSTGLKDNPDRTAAFRVLRTAQLPSVLIELGFVSNKDDAQLLKSDTWRNKVTDSIATAVDNYFSHQLARLPM
jgi:N-acetylmuramoyl-L-alanine amidase